MNKVLSFRPPNFNFKYLMYQDTFYMDSQCAVILNYSALSVPPHEISNNVVCATSKASDQSAHTCSLIRAIGSCLNIL